MSDLPAIVGAGGEFECDVPVVGPEGQIVMNEDGTIKLERRRYVWTPLTIGELAQFENDLRTQFAARLDMLGPAVLGCDAANLKGDDRKAALEAAMHEHLRLRRLGPFALLDELCIPEANALMLQVHLKRNHPLLSLDEVKYMIGSSVFGSVASMIVQQAQAALPGKVRLPRSAVGSASAKDQTTAATSD